MPVCVKMIKIYKIINKELQEIDSYEKDSWVNITHPKKEELEKISKELQIPLDFLTDPTDIDERARIEIEKKTILNVLRIPRFEGDDIEIPFATVPLGIIFSDDFVITICLKDTEVINDFINKKVKFFSITNKTRFLLQILLKTSMLYLNYLKEINRRTSSIEKELHIAMKNEELIKLLNIEKSLVSFTSSLKSNELMMEKLQIGKIIKINLEDKDFLEDVIIDNRQAIEMSNIYSNILSGMMDAFASVISNNLNVVLKFLTSITIILMIPTLIASIYGMNVVLPFQQSPQAFGITMVISLVFSIIGVLIFIKRRWF
jgi:magnesium transporter